MGIQGLEGWSIKMDLFFIVHSSFWVTIQVDLGEFGFWTVGCVDGYSGLRGLIFWSIKTDFYVSL